MSESQPVVEEKRGRGRPRGWRAPPTAPVSLRVPVHMYDQLAHVANQRGISVNKVVQSLVYSGLRRSS